MNLNDCQCLTSKNRFIPACDMICAKLFADSVVDLTKDIKFTDDHDNDASRIFAFIDVVSTTIQLNKKIGLYGVGAKHAECLLHFCFNNIAKCEVAKNEFLRFWYVNAS